MHAKISHQPHKQQFRRASDSLYPADMPNVFDQFDEGASKDFRSKAVEDENSAIFEVRMSNAANNSRNYRGQPSPKGLSAMRVVGIWPEFDRDSGFLHQNSGINFGELLNLRTSR